LNKKNDVMFLSLLITLSGISNSQTGKPDDENTFGNPENVVHVKSVFKASTKFDYTAPAMSMKVIMIKKKI
jgi:alpha-L-arabinofuranosidase